MPITINSNISATLAQRRLSENTRTLKQTFERLSSGLRINRAGDDSAGLAVSESLKADTRVYLQGVRNFNDGLSLLNVADGAMEELGSIVTRLKELAEQSANGIYGNVQRSALDAEAQALSKEFTRITQSTSFNGRALFRSDFGSLSLQGGYSSNGNIQSSLGGAVGNGSFSTQFYNGSQSPLTADFNRDGFLDIASVNSAAGRTYITLGNGDGTFRASVSYNSASSPSSLAEGDFNGDGIIDLASSGSLSNSTSVSLGNGDGTFRQVTNYTISTNLSGITSSDFNGDGLSDLAVGVTTGNLAVLLANANGSFSAPTLFAIGNGAHDLTTGDFNNDRITDVLVSNASSNTVSLLLGVGNGTFSSAGSVSAPAGTASVSTADFNSDGNLDFATGNRVYLGTGTGSFGSGISISGSASGAVVALDANGDGAMDVATETNIVYGNNNGTFTNGAGVGGFGEFASGDLNSDGVADIIDTFTIYLQRTTTGVSALMPFSLSTKIDALEALAPLDRKLTQLSQQRGIIGAFQSRLITATSTLGAAAENFATASSRITDADVAEETASLVRGQILQRSSALVLAQANLQPGIALQLLKEG